MLEESGSTRRSRILAAFLGWTFDGFDGFLYVLVGFRVVADLVARHASAAADAVTLQKDATLKATIIQATFLFGWAIGGVVFGWLGDRMGRVRALRHTILIYAVCTGLCAFADTWWQLLIFRFIASLGIGGEWAAGATLVAESIPPRDRAWASAALQSGYIMGCIAAALVVRCMADFDPRYVFLFGLIPAALTIWIRRSVKESPVWKSGQATAKPDAPPEPPWRIWRSLIITGGISAAALTGAWAFLFFIGPVVRDAAVAAGWDTARGERLLADVTIAYFVVNIGANFAATYCAKLIGYKATFVVFFLGAGAVLLACFGSPLAVDNVFLITSAFAFFGLGIFAVFPYYIPTVFPLASRNLCSGATYNFGRIIAGVGTLAAGWISATAGGAREALWWLWVVYAVAIVFGLIAERSRFIVRAQ